MRFASYRSGDGASFGVLTPKDMLDLSKVVPGGSADLLSLIVEGYRARGAETKYPEYPQFFTKPPTAVIGPDAPFYHDPAMTNGSRARAWTAPARSGQSS